MKSYYLNFIKDCLIFQSLEESICEIICEKFTHVDLKPGEILFNQNDPSDGFFILIEGTLQAVVVTPEFRKIIGNIEKGESVGELGALSGAPRTLTIESLTHAKLLKLSGADFVTLCYQHPSIIMETIKPIISRSQKNIKFLSQEKNTVYKGVLLDKFNPNLNLLKRKFKENAPKEADYLFLLESQVNNQDKIKLFQEYEKKYKQIIILFDSENADFLMLMLAKCSEIYILADSSENGILPYTASTIVHNLELRHKITFNLILIHRIENQAPTNTKQWLNDGFFQNHHHLRIQNDSDYQRIFRAISGNSIGLVLGGGGTRGFAHVGVFRALMKAKIPIDHVGGTSIGAIAGAGFILSENNEEKLNYYFEELKKNGNPPIGLKDLTIPILSFASGQKLFSCLNDLYGDLQIEDMIVPFFCATTNLTRYCSEMHNSGLLTTLLKATSALPLVYSPTIINGQLHFDGGLSNNLPVNKMRDIVGQDGKVFAVRIIGFHENVKTYNFPPILSIKDILMNAIPFRKKIFDFPPFFNTYYNVILYGSAAKDLENSTYTDVLISPDLKGFGILKNFPKNIIKLIELGYNETMEHLKSWEYSHAKGKLIPKT